MLFRCCVDTLFCCFTDVLFCWLSVLLFCGHIDLRIPVGYIGLERQQGFGRCPHSCIGEGWASRQWRKLDKYMIEATETGHTPQKSPRSITCITKLHHGSNTRKMGNKLILDNSGSRPANERWGGKRETQHPAEAWFFSFLSVASSKAGRSEYDNLFRGEKALLRAAFLCGNPTGA